MPHDTALNALSQLLGERFSLSKSDLAAHGQNETYFADCPPEGVAYPESTAEVSEIVKICAANDCPVVAWGAGTSLEGHALAIKGGIVLDFARMNKVLAINAEDMDAVVQPGITREDLNTELRTTGLFFPVDPGANASIGGMAATRASGTTAVRYGTMRENVLALEAVLADGTIIRTGTRARKSSAGYDLTHLLVGSEGTLAIITELTVRLQGQPESISAAVCAFDDMDTAVNTVMATIQMGIPIARIEFLDAASVAAVNAYSKTDMPVQPHLMVEFHGSEMGAKEQVERFGELVEDFGGHGFKWSAKTEERNALWDARHKAYWAILASRPGYKAVVTDMCVPISRLAEAVAETQKDIADAGLQGPILGHVGDGNFHAILLLDPANPDDLTRAKEVSHRMAERALALGGTITGEHGVGMGKLSLMPAEHGDAWDVMGAIKTAMDPKGILNPGKIVRPA